jgi:hypothetical protein
MPKVNKFFLMATGPLSPKVRERSLNHSQEENKMEAETKMATDRQLAYIERLGADVETTTGKHITELTMTDASELIADLLQKANVGQNGNGAATGKTTMAILGRKTDFGSGARLGMAFKCVYRKWTSNGADIFKHRKNFIDTVLETYKLINEISEKALEVPTA